jgi:CRP-like cAMP-binding protein
MMSRRSALDFLEHEGWLGLTSPKFRQEVLARARCIHVSKGTPLYHVGDETTGLFGIASGSVGLDVILRWDETLLGDLLPAGSWLGDAAFVTRQPRRISVTAAEDCEILSLPAFELQMIIDHDKESWRWLAVLNVLSLDRAMRVGTDLMIRDPNQRLVAVLARLAAQFDGRPRSGAVTLCLNQDELARLANVSRTLLGEKMREFEAEGHLRLGYRQVTVINMRGILQGSGLQS